MTAAQRKAQRDRLEQIRAEVLAIVSRGFCPDCGSELRRNLALTGWWQCEQFGAVTHRARPLEPQCSWQGFTS
jgi:hypothetical protein